MKTLTLGLGLCLLVSSAFVVAARAQNDDAMEKLIAIVMMQEKANDISVSFAANSAVLSPAALAAVKKQAAMLLQMPKGTVIDIESHNYGVADEAANIALTQKRADAVKAALGRLGLNPAQLTANGLGSGYPLVSDATGGEPVNKTRIEYRITMLPETADYKAQYSETRVPKTAAKTVAVGQKSAAPKPPATPVNAGNIAAETPAALKVRGERCVESGEPAEKCSAIFAKIRAVEPSYTGGGTAFRKRADANFQKGANENINYGTDENRAFWNNVIADYAAAAEFGGQKEEAYSKFDLVIHGLGAIIPREWANGYRDGHYDKMIERDPANVCARYHRVQSKSYFSEYRSKWDAILSNYNGKDGAGCAASAALMIGRLWAEGDQYAKVAKDVDKAREYYEKALRIGPSQPNVAAWMAELPAKTRVTSAGTISGSSSGSSSGGTRPSVNNALAAEALKAFDTLIAKLEANDAAYDVLYQAIARQIEKDQRSGIRANLFMKSERRRANQLLENSRNLINEFLRKYDSVLERTGRSRLQGWLDGLPYYIPI